MPYECTTPGEMTDRAPYRGRDPTCTASGKTFYSNDPASGFDSIGAACKRKLHSRCWQGGASTHRRLKFDFEEVTYHIVERQELELIERQRDVCQLDHLEIA